MSDFSPTTSLNIMKVEVQQWGAGGAETLWGIYEPAQILLTRDEEKHVRLFVITDEFRMKFQQW